MKLSRCRGVIPNAIAIFLGIAVESDLYAEEMKSMSIDGNKDQIQKSVSELWNAVERGDEDLYVLNYGLGGYIPVNCSKFEVNRPGKKANIKFGLLNGRPFGIVKGRDLFHIPIDLDGLVTSHAKYKLSSQVVGISDGQVSNYHVWMARIFEVSGHKTDGKLHTVHSWPEPSEVYQLFISTNPKFLERLAGRTDKTITCEDL